MDDQYQRLTAELFLPISPVTIMYQVMDFTNVKLSIHSAEKTTVRPDRYQWNRWNRWNRWGHLLTKQHGTSPKKWLNTAGHTVMTVPLNSPASYGSINRTVGALSDIGGIKCKFNKEATQDYLSFLAGDIILDSGKAYSNRPILTLPSITEKQFLDLLEALFYALILPQLWQQKAIPLSQPLPSEPLVAQFPVDRHLIQKYGASYQKNYQCLATDTGLHVLHHKEEAIPFAHDPQKGRPASIVFYTPTPSLPEGFYGATAGTASIENPHPETPDQFTDQSTGQAVGGLPAPGTNTVPLTIGNLTRKNLSLHNSQHKPSYLSTGLSSQQSPHSSVFKPLGQPGFPWHQGNQ